MARCICFPNHVYQLEKVGEEIESIRTRLADIEINRQRFGIHDLVSTTTLRSVGDRLCFPWDMDEGIVGLEDDLDLLLRKAVFHDKPALSVSTIAGMGGIGKTTLASMVFNHPEITARFDCRAWVCVSHEFNAQNVMERIMLQLTDLDEDKFKLSEAIRKLHVDQLYEILYTRLQGRRYFIVLDDIWDLEIWESLARAFPKGDIGSRVLLTSRRTDITPCAHYVHSLQNLNHKNSWTLFLKKASIDKSYDQVPEDLKNIGNEIMKMCDGLPLAIIVVGGMLRDKFLTVSEWENVLNGMKSQFGRNKTSLSAILAMSYHSLPSKLKSCFLCLGFFREDAIISADKLVQLWIVEGLIQVEGEEQTLETIATSYLQELINRNMVQVMDKSWDKRVENCRLHDLFRDLCLKKAKEEIRFEYLKGVDIRTNCKSSTSTSSSTSNRSRHCTIFRDGEKTFYPNPTHLRSFFYYGECDFDGFSSYLKKCRLLRVLDMERILSGYLHDSIGSLIGLKFLSLTNMTLRELPSSLGCLKNLKVLYIIQTIVLKVPNVIWKLDSLRHLYMSEILCDVPLRIHTLKNLERLSFILLTQIETPELLIMMPSLRHLTINLEDISSSLSPLYNSVAFPENIYCLNFICPVPNGPTDFPFLYNKFDVLCNLTELSLNIKMNRLPSLPTSIAKLTLADTFFKENPMPVLEILPNLTYLRLVGTVYEGPKMGFSEGFHRLQLLSIYMTPLKIGEGAMPALEHLELDKVEDLEMLVEKLKLITSLQELIVTDKEDIIYRIRGIDLAKITGIPRITFHVRSS